MSKAFPNPYHQARSQGEQGTPKLRALVVNVMDPLKAGRVQIRVHGAMDDEQAIPDERLPWVKIEGSTSTGSLQTYTGTHGLIPGTEVYVDKHGEGGQDYVITATVPNDRKDDQQSIHPATQGKGATDSIWSEQEHSTSQQGSGNFGWHKPLRDIVQSRTTQEAREIRDRAGRYRKRTKEPISTARDNVPAGGSGEKRRQSKDPKGGSIGSHKFTSTQDAQKFIQQTIQNRSAVVPNALNALMQLKKVTGNPTSIQSIGAGNFSAILGQLSSLFGSKGGGKKQPEPEEKIYDCEQLLNIDDSLLSKEQLLQKQTCILIEETKQEPIENEIFLYEVNPDTPAFNITTGSTGGGSPGGGGNSNNHTHSIEQITGLAEALANKANTAHTHTMEQISGLAEALEDMVELIGIGPPPEGGPYAPEVHTHEIEDITGLTDALAAKAANTHSHAISDITDLETTLGGKAATNHTHDIEDVTGLQTALDGKSATNHTHVIGDITNLQTTLDGKAATNHTHVIGDITNLQTTLDGKAATNHTHAIADVTGLQTALDGKFSPVCNNYGNTGAVSGTTTATLNLGENISVGQVVVARNNDNPGWTIEISRNNGSTWTFICVATSDIIQRPVIHLYPNHVVVNDGGWIDPPLNIPNGTGNTQFRLLKNGNGNTVTLSAYRIM